MHELLGPAANSGAGAGPRECRRRTGAEVSHGGRFDGLVRLEGDLFRVGRPVSQGHEGREAADREEGREVAQGKAMKGAKKVKPPRP